MIDLQQKLQANILDRLNRRKNQRLTRREFEKAIEAMKKQLQTDPDAIQQGVEALLREECVSRTVRGTYRLEKKGTDYLARLESTLSGPAPEINEELLAYQKAFVLMQLFCAEDNSLPQGRLREKLSSAATRDALLFARMTSDPPVNPDPPTIDWVVRKLVQSKDIDEPRKGRFHLTDRGRESLIATDQHPSLQFRITGKQLNALREAIRDVSPVAQLKPEQRDEAAPSVPAAPSVSPSLTTEAVLNAFEDLRRERFARNGIVPVYELRRLLIARHGTEAGSHAVLDPLLKQMRREKRVRMIAIGDLSEATTDQLDDSVPGENETFFYLETADEYAYTR